MTYIRTPCGLQVFAVLVALKYIHWFKSCIILSLISIFCFEKLILVLKYQSKNALQGYIQNKEKGGDCCKYALKL